MKQNISKILKRGAKLKAKKLTKTDLELLDKIIEEQKKIPKPIRFPYGRVK